ncbi:hypothetical protein [Microbacterium trichothecenolyticum]|uniref:DUF4190 domain-containing protein n=1 Tax=Microbacterium trichothecenolyticum TaxID=69370 RepID=A0ABU0TU57_MICTR|nr:hypothetical protein [Microbacterium trichothecenolyticum]MDQ1123205.1 hypothetical protein [Microbacterium trichothecenolyticum]
MNEVPSTRRARKATEGEPVALAAAIAQPVSADPDADDPNRLPTAQLEMAAFGDHVLPYAPPVPPPPPPLAPWALAAAIIALAAALFTGWLLPLGIVALVIAAIALRRRRGSRRVAIWALALSLLSVAFSVGWLVWGFSQLALA